LGARIPALQSKKKVEMYSPKKLRGILFNSFTSYPGQKKWGHIPFFEAVSVYRNQGGKPHESALIFLKPVVGFGVPSGDFYPDRKKSSRNPENCIGSVTLPASPPSI
jgi:hypothetical protein